MSQVTGVVSSITPRQWNNKTLYSLTVSGVNYGAGDRQPACSVGDTVSFTATKKGDYNNIAPNTLQVVPAAAGAPATPAVSAHDVRQRIIQYQAARNSAITAVDILLKAEAIKLPAAQAKKADAILALIDELTDRFDSDTLEIGEFGARQRDSGVDLDGEE